MESDVEPKPVMRLRLYIAGDSPNSLQARENFRRLVSQFFPPEWRYDLDIVDVLQNPQCAAGDLVSITPTLIKADDPMQRVVGNLEDYEHVVQALFGKPGISDAADPASPAAEAFRLTRQLARIEANLEALFADQADAIVHPEGGHPILLREAVEALKRSEARYRHLAHHDALTGLANRSLFAERLEHAIEQARRDHRGFALLYLDVDRFKSVNDALGHQAGDRLLEQFAERLRDSVRGVDAVARVGGDEFTILAEGVGTPGSAARLAIKVIDAVSKPMTVAGRTLTPSTSIGITLFPHDGGDAESLIRAADKAMYRAKAKGRGGFYFHNPRFRSDSGSVGQLKSELQDALQSGEFELYFQPEVALPSRMIMGMEALLRWNHPRRGLLRPEAFLSVAEDTGLVRPLGDWVLHSAAEQAFRWREAGHRLRMTINLSAGEISRTDLAERVGSVLSELGVTARDLDLEIEIPEQLLGEAGKNVRVLQQLPGLGVTLSVDRCGKDYAVVDALKRLPIKHLKLDARLLRDFDADPIGRAFARGFIAMGHSLGLAVGASGLETPSQLDALLPQDCDEAQGFLFSPPLPAGAASELLERREPLH